MSRIGIVCADDTELAPFLDKMAITNTTKKVMLTFYEGTISGADAVAVFSGVCKVNAAVAAQVLIDHFHADVIFNAGAAGGIDERLKPFDTVISEQAVYHDVDESILTEFHPWLKSAGFPANEKLLAVAREYAADSARPIYIGKMVTGEQFIENEKRQEIRQKLNPLSADMETASIAHVCFVNSIPFLAVRTITDTQAHEGMESYEQNGARAAAVAADIVAALIEKMDIQ